MPGSIRAGDVLAQRYRLDDLLSESGDARFWHAFDTVLTRSVAIHIIASTDERAPRLLDAARRSATLVDRRILRVLDARDSGGVVYVVNEWGSGDSLDITLTGAGPMAPREAAWLVAEVAETIARAHEAGLAHGRLNPENVLVDHNGEVRIIGFGVDAALHGLPPGRRSTDVHDLAGLLYAAMTGRWAGTSTSRVPGAPQEQGALLRPRRVRAGIPRLLDGLCDEVLNPYAASHASRPDHDLSTARGLADALTEFVGDAPTREPHRHPETEPAIGSVPPPAAKPEPVDMPTQAGIPAFTEDDPEDDVSWLTPRDDRPPPPPAFAQPPDRPLFAPDPPRGQPVRRPRPGVTTTAPASAPAAVRDSRAHTGSGFWPWESGTGSGILSSVAEEEVPGRNWLRLAMVVGLVALLVVAVLAVLQLRNDDGDPASEDTTGQARDRPRAVPLTGVTAQDFDPQGDAPFEEYPDLVPLALDGDPATAWQTNTYNQNLGPGGLKTGVGLVLDLGSAKTLRSVRLTLPGGPTSAEVFRTGEVPTTVDGLEAVADGSTTGDDPALTLRLPDDVADQYVVVWLTSLPPVDGGFRGQIAEVVVAG
ncbi:protein kinase family protein [Nocardioides sp. InS609-2]|uniref:protein kinase family protein n=1 Tax=Nocardioides sp. InS609-2 TaxID=2760705 RepID=UPI0020BE61E1|nr:protein kinase family protein [Nocardioides sp. InS609-2]